VFQNSKKPLEYKITKTVTAATTQAEVFRFMIEYMGDGAAAGAVTSTTYQNITVASGQTANTATLTNQTPGWYRVTEVQSHNTNYDLDTGVLATQNPGAAVDTTAGSVTYRVTDSTRTFAFRNSRKPIEFLIRKNLTAPAEEEEKFVFLVEYGGNGATNGAVERTMYAVITIPAGQSSGTAKFVRQPMGWYRVTEQDTNWRFSNVRSALTPDNPGAIIHSSLPRVTARVLDNTREFTFLNQRKDVPWANGKASVRNNMPAISTSVTLTPASGTYTDPQTGVPWRIIAQSGEYKLLITERAYATGMSYNGGAGYALYENTDPANGMMKQMTDWYNNPANVGSNLKAMAVGYEYHGEAAKGTVGAGIEYDWNGIFSMIATISGLNEGYDRATTLPSGAMGNGQPFPLSWVEVNRYFEPGADRIARLANNSVAAWRLRSPANSSNPFAGVSTAGAVNNVAPTANVNIRPALWVRMP
jgi:hypothetical protein